MKIADSFNGFIEARYGLFIHYGLYSLLGRGEWVWNREEIPMAEYASLADRFTAEKFDANALCDLAVRGGMKYVVLTTMHHEGFRLYDTDLSSFNAVKSPAGRDLVAELVDAARARNLRVGLYHSLNNWYDKPDSVDALEDEAARRVFIDHTFARIKELVTRFDPIDVLWYDGWWPFNAEGWEAKQMNEMVRAIQPHILFNGRNGLPGDFATPEGHMSAPTPWRPWEACMTINNNWGYHTGDHEWKTPLQVIDLLVKAAQGVGNLLLNIGPRGDGSVPKASVKIIEEVGAWLERVGNEAIFGTEQFTYDLQERGDHRGDWNHHGPLTAKGNSLYWLLRYWPGSTVTLGGLHARVRKAEVLGAPGISVRVEQKGTRVVFSGLPDSPPDPLCPVLRIECEEFPILYQCGGLRTPNVLHPHYDPCPSDIQQ